MSRRVRVWRDSLSISVRSTIYRAEGKEKSFFHEDSMHFENFTKENYENYEKNLKS